MRGSRNFHERGSNENGNFWSQTRGGSNTQKSRNYLFLGKIFKFQGGSGPPVPPSGSAHGAHELGGHLWGSALYTQQKKLRKMCLRACNTRTVKFHEIWTSYYYKLSFYLSNEGLSETTALTEAWKIIVKVDWSSHHFSQNCQIVRFVYQSSMELFHTITISPYTHFLMKSWTVYILRCCKAFSAPVSLLVPGRQCQMKIIPGSTKITYVRTLWSRTRQPTHQTWIPLTKSYTFWDSLVGSGVEYCHQDLSRLLLWCFGGNRGWFLSTKLGILVVRLKKVGWSWCIAGWYCHLGTDTGAGKAGWHASTSCFVHWSVVMTKLSSETSMLLRQESSLTLFTRTKQYWNFVKTGLTTSQLWQWLSRPLQVLSVQISPHGKDKKTLNTILKFQFLNLC